jgi:hypothetical protein
MADTRSPQDLFKAWRSGDGAAGQAMAQKFADWYYAIAVSRLGEGRGRAPCDAACARFGQGVVGVTEGRALVKWAHGIVVEEVAKGGGAARDGDEPNAYTANQSPKALLGAAKAALPAEIGLLEAVYGRTMDEAGQARLAEPLGGLPMGVLVSRYRVKSWLKANKGIPFAVTPDKPVLDRAPLPVYESGAMANENEIAQFEQWMLSESDLCRDIAEFATYSVALRGGIKSTGKAAGPAAKAAAPSKATPAPTPNAPAAAAPAEPSPSGGGLGRGVIVGVAILAVLAMLAISAIVLAINFL